MKTFLALCLFVPSLASAATNLPLVCTDQTNPCPAAKYVYKPGADGLLVLNPANQWKRWESLAPADPVRVCPSNIESGSISCPALRVTLAKSQTTQAVPITQWRATIRWDAVTKGTGGVDLPPGEIVGYSLNWRYEAEGGIQTVSVGSAPTYALTIQNKNVCIAVAAIGKSANSNYTIEQCVKPTGPTPVGAVPATPENVVVTFEPV